MVTTGWLSRGGYHGVVTTLWLLSGGFHGVVTTGWLPREGYRWWLSRVDLMNAFCDVLESKIGPKSQKKFWKFFGFLHSVDAF